jgi:hypothetical protein
MSREVESAQSRDIETGPRNGDDLELSKYERKMAWESVSCELLQGAFLLKDTNDLQQGEVRMRR